MQSQSVNGKNGTLLQKREEWDRKSREKAGDDGIYGEGLSLISEG